jgi:hypothetical protein
MRHIIRRRARRPSAGTLLGSAALIVACTGAAYASIPASDGTIRGCYAATNGLLLGIPHSKGDTRIVDSAEACRSYEQPITWNQTGQKGDPGAAGEPASALWAVLDGDGTVARSSHVKLGGGTGRGPGGAGSYFVQFDRSILACAYVVSPEGAATAARILGEPSNTQIQVSTTNASGPVDSTVHVAVFC